MGLDDPAADPEAQAHAAEATPGLEALEPAEQAELVRGIDPDSAILAREARAVRATLDRHDARASFAEIAGAGEEGGAELADALPVPLAPRGPAPPHAPGAGAAPH